MDHAEQNHGGNTAIAAGEAMTGVHGDARAVAGPGAWNSTTTTHDSTGTLTTGDACSIIVDLLRRLIAVQRERDAETLRADRQGAGWRESIERNRDAYHRLHRAEHENGRLRQELRDLAVENARLRDELRRGRLAGAA